MLLGYVLSMKSNAKLVFAAQAVPNDNIRVLTPTEIQQWQVNTP